MKHMKIAAFVCAAGILVSSCATSQGNGTLIGGGAGAALGALAGRLIGGNAKGTIIGTAIGTAVGATAGNLIGKKMDKKKAELAAQLANAQVTEVTDINGLPAVKVTFDSGLLFGTGSSAISAASAADLSKLSASMKADPSFEVAVLGYTDNQGWKNSNAEQSAQKNLNLSQQRADAVKAQLLKNGVPAGQIKTSAGYGEANPVADNATAEGQKANRRVEVYMYASQDMINAANAGTLQ